MQIAITLKDWFQCSNCLLSKADEFVDQIAVGYVFQKADLNNDINFFFFEQMNEF